MADVIPLPTRDAPPPRRVLRLPNPLAVVGRGRWLTSWDIDDWGRDDTLARAVAAATRLRWTTSIGGLELLPAEGGAVVVINSRRLALTPWFVALTLSDALDRPVRFVGRPDAAPFGAVARRLGGLLARPDEVCGALRDGQLLVIGLSGTIDPRKAGTIDPRLLGPAVERKLPVFPAAVTTPQTSRGARIEIGRAVALPRRRRGPLAEVDLARLVEKRLRLLLGSPGGSQTGTVLDRIPFAPWGRD